MLSRSVNIIYTTFQSSYINIPSKNGLKEKYNVLPVIISKHTLRRRRRRERSRSQRMRLKHLHQTTPTSPGSKRAPTSVMRRSSVTDSYFYVLRTGCRFSTAFRSHIDLKCLILSNYMLSWKAEKTSAYLDLKCWLWFYSPHSDNYTSKYLVYSIVIVFFIL